jgi:Ca2+-transporting ATPase
MIIVLMSSGTEVAKTASDIILMDDSFSNIVVAIKTGRCVNDSVRKFVQFQLSVNVAAILLTFVSAIASSSDGSILSAVQLLWVNLIMDTFAALALATDPPTDSSLDRKPSRKSEPLINVDMTKMILIQAIYQCIVCFVLHFAGLQILGEESTPGSEAELRTLVFNVFVFCQIFNQINCRRLDRKFNVFEGFFKNYWFMGIFLIMCGGQVLIVEVGGAAFQVTRIYGRDWAISIIAGLLSFPIGVLVRLIPTEPIYRFLIRCKIYQDPSKLPTITQEEEDVEGLNRFEYNPALETITDNLKTYNTIRGGRIRGSSIVLKSRSKRLREADIQLPTLLTMVPTVIAGTVGAGATWLTQAMHPSEMADPASQDPSRSTAELFAGKVQMHPDTDPSDPLFAKFGIDPMEK